MNILAEDFKNSVKTLRNENTVIRILFEGKYLIIGKRNKSYWKRIADAKMCLKEHIKNMRFDFFEYSYANGYTHNTTGKVFDVTELHRLQTEAYQEILDQVTFVRVNVE
jgi:hypothetical protein